MSITTILTAEKVPAVEKLEQVAQIIAGARKNYGNEEMVIECPRVDTAHGSMPFNVLEADSKVAVLRSEVGMIKAFAVEAAEQFPGTNINKKIEELLATNGLFCNVDSGAKFEYI
jgi:hypothetical protein